MREEPGGPVARATATLLDWLSTAGVRARLASPGHRRPDAKSLCVWPVALLPEQAVRSSAGGSPLRLRVRYLLTVDAAAGEVAELLDRVLVASLGASAVEVVVEPVTMDTWRAFGVSPRIGLYAEVRTHAAPPRPVLPRVRRPLSLAGQPLGRIHGQALGPGGTPVPGMRVVVTDTGAATYTDNRGRFDFPALPAGQPVRLLLSGKGLELVAEVTAPTREPVIIHCDMEEV